MKYIGFLVAAVAAGSSLNIIAAEIASEKTNQAVNEAVSVSPAPVSLNGTISGVVTASESGKKLSGAKVIVVGKPYSATTDINGKYEIQVPEGSYEIAVTHEKYGRKNNKNIVVKGNSTSAINIALVLSGSTGAAMVATGEAVEEPVETKREAAAIMDSISTEQIAKSGDSDAGAAVKRVSGVALVGGQYAVVRGLGGRYISTQLNGGSIPSTNPLSRDVALDLFPASTLQGIEIHKSFTANLPGDSTGGSINMVTKNIPDEQVGKLTLGTGFRTGVTGKDVISYKGGDTDMLGYDDGTREMPSLLNGVTFFGQNSFSVCGNPDYCVTPAYGAKLAKSLENNYNTEEKRAAPDMDLGISYGNSVDVDEKGTFAYYGDANYKNKWTARQDAEIHDESGDFTYERSKRNIDVNAYGVLGFTDADETYELQSKTILLRKTDDTTRKTDGIDGEGTEVQDVTLQWVERSYVGQAFSGKHKFADDVHQLDWLANVGQTYVHEPDRRSYQFRGGQIFPSTLERRYTEQTENSGDLGADYTFNWDADDITGKLIGGVLVSMKDRETYLGRFGVSQNLNFVTTGLDLEQLLTPANFDAGNFTLLVKTSPTDSYKAKDEVDAFYLNSETSFDETWLLVAGVRFEDGKQELTYQYAPKSNDTYETSEVLPAVALTWKMTDDWQLRAGYSKTLSRPGLTERSLSSQYDPETDEQVFGNNALILSKIDNLDFRAEYYFDDVDSASIGVFTKNIDSPIERTVPDASGSAANGYTFVNQDKAVVSGIELDGRKTLFEMSEFLTYISSNVSIMDSNVELAGRSIVLEGVKERKLQGQSDILANIQIGMDKLDESQSLNFIINYFDDRIAKAGRKGQSETEDGRPTMDVVYKYDVTEDWKLTAKVQNIFNQKVSYSIEDATSESYKEGTYVNVVMNYDF